MNIYFLIRSEEGLTLETSALESIYTVVKLVVCVAAMLVDKTKENFLAKFA